MTATHTLFWTATVGLFLSNFLQLAGAEQQLPLLKESPSSLSAAVDVGILTPKAPASPRINGARIYGCRPGHALIYRIPCTGQRPIKFSVENLPRGLTVDNETGIISGAIASAGEYKATLHASSDAGSSSRPWKLVCGDKIALTPPMGFNDWYAYYDQISDARMRHAADIMLSSGLADAGYQYVNIDDCWNFKIPKSLAGQDETKAESLLPSPMFGRDADGNMKPNENFGDMKAFTAYIHSKGLKAGIYSSPGPRTCANYVGSWNHEAADAKRIADWQFDFFKYDWCSYNSVLHGRKPSLSESISPYSLMGKSLAKQDRDIVYNICQYGDNDVWKWGASVGGNAWRTSGDLGGELSRFFDIALKNASLHEYCRPGEWNDPDYIQIGFIGGDKPGAPSHPCPYTHTEQYSFMSLWCLISSPLFYSGDLERLDDFTLNVLTNHEVIDINQDALGKCAKPVCVTDKSFVLVKELEDGSKAVGFCNRSSGEANITASWRDLALTGKQRVHDLWRQQDTGVAADTLSYKVPPHGVMLVRITALR